MNQIPATAGASGHVKFVDGDMESLPHDFAEGDDIIAAIRPNDIIPHGDGARSPGADDVIETEANAIKVIVSEMEFLGSFWRCRLQHAIFGGNELIADFSINAVRRLDLSEGGEMLIELPKSRLMAFARTEQAA